LQRGKFVPTKTKSRRSSSKQHAFAFGVAKPLYRKGIHPRLLAGPAEIEAIRKRTRSGVGSVILAGLHKRVDPMIDGILAAPDDAAAIKVVAGAYYGWELWHCLDEIAALGLIEQDDRPLRAVRRVLMAMPTAISEEDGKPVEIVGTLSILANAYDLAHSIFSKDDLAKLVPWIVERGVRQPLAKARKTIYRCAGGNTPLVVVLSALYLTLAVEGDPGAPDLTAERDELVKIFDAIMHVSHGRDGYPCEDIGYGTGVSAYLSLAAEAARRAGVYDPYTQCPRYAKFARSILHFVQPWGMHLTSTGDHYDAFVERIFVLGRQAHETRDPSLAWLATTLHSSWEPLGSPELDIAKGQQLPASWHTLLVLDDLKPVHPSKAKVPTQFVDRTRGLVSFRSAWDDDALYVTLDGGQRSTAAAGHQHASGGHFNLSALGEYFAIDCGRYNMEQSCHSVVLVNGKSGRSTDGQWHALYQDGVLTGYQPGAFVDTASVDTSHQHDCYWAKRTLGLVKGDAPYVWIVDDLNKNHDWCDYWWQIHSSPENVISYENGGDTNRATIKGWRHGNLLDVHILMPDASLYPKAHSIKMEQDEAISSSTKYVADPYGRAKTFKRPSDMLRTSVFVRPRMLAKIAGYEGRFLTFLIPRRADEAPATIERVKSLPGTFIARVKFRGIEDTVAWAYEHSLLEGDGYKARGQWRVERRKKGKLVAAAGAESATGLVG